MNRDVAIKFIGFSAIGLVVFWIIKAVFFPVGYGVSVRYSMPGAVRYGNEHGYMTNYAVNNFGTTILQILLFIFVITLLLGVVMILKSLFTAEDLASIKGTFITKQTQPAVHCSDCGKVLNQNWKVCPHCGREAKNQDNQ